MKMSMLGDVRSTKNGSATTSYFLFRLRKTVDPSGKFRVTTRARQFVHLRCHLLTAFLWRASTPGGPHANTLLTARQHIWGATCQLPTAWHTRSAVFDSSTFVLTDVSCGPRLRSHMVPTSHTQRRRPVRTTLNPALSMDATTRAQMKNATVKICIARRPCHRALQKKRRDKDKAGDRGLVFS